MAAPSSGPAVGESPAPFEVEDVTGPSEGSPSVIAANMATSRSFVSSFTIPVK